MEKHECRRCFCSYLYSMHLKAILRLNANNTQTKITKTKEMVTGSQNGLIVGYCFLLVCWKLSQLYYQWFIKTWPVLTAQYFTDEFRMSLFTLIEENDDGTLTSLEALKIKPISSYPRLPEQPFPTYVYSLCRALILPHPSPHY